MGSFGLQLEPNGKQLQSLKRHSFAGKGQQSVMQKKTAKRRENAPVQTLDSAHTKHSHHSKRALYALGRFACEKYEDYSCSEVAGQLAGGVEAAEYNKYSSE